MFVHSCIVIIQLKLDRISLVTKRFITCLILPEGYAGPVRVEYITSGDVTIGLRYIILSVMELDGGLYSCTATNKFGSDTKQLTLNVKLDYGSGGGGSGETNEAKLIEI